MTQPLEGFTVLDLTRVLSGPYCTMLLADMGARVIKIEQPGKGDDTRGWGPPFLEGESAYFLSINRNKESVTLDFKTPEGRSILDQLIARSDVLVENFRPGTLDKIGLDYASLAAAHPKLIVCSISGFGQTGPRRSEAGYDAVIQAEGGLMSITGAADGPPYRLGVAIGDIVTGMFARAGRAAGAAGARANRPRTARGRRDARFRRRAADVSGGHPFRDRDAASANRQSPSDHRSLRAVLGVGRRFRARDRERRPVAAVLQVAGLSDDERFRTNRAARHAVRRAEAHPRRRAGTRHAPSPGSIDCRPRAFPAGRSGIWQRYSPTLSFRHAIWWPASSTP